MARPAEILKRPYSRLVIPEEDGTFRAEIVEFPGCIASGDTAATALASLEEIAESWLESILANGQTIPEPIEAAEYSGKLVLRLPKSIHQRAAFAAKRDGVSLNQFISTAVAMQVGALDCVRGQPHLSYNNVTVLPQFTGTAVIISQSTSVGASHPDTTRWLNMGENREPIFERRFVDG